MRTPRRYLFILAVLAAACVPAAIAAAELASDTPQPRGGGLFRSLSPQQKMMMFVDMHKATAGMNDDQKRFYRLSQRQKFAAMTDSERQQFTAKLQAEWESLPNDQKESIKAQVMGWRARHASRGDGGGQDAR